MLKYASYHSDSSKELYSFVFQLIFTQEKNLQILNKNLQDLQQNLTRLVQVKDLLYIHLKSCKNCAP